MRYIVRSHDAWGSIPVGEFQSQEEAQALLDSLRSDCWFIADGGMKGLSIVESGLEGERTIASFSFQQD
jgi:hypothetical protein